MAVTAVRNSVTTSAADASQTASDWRNSDFYVTNELAPTAASLQVMTEAGPIEAKAHSVGTTGRVEAPLRHWLRTTVASNLALAANSVTNERAAVMSLAGDITWPAG